MHHALRESSVRVCALVEDCLHAGDLAAGDRPRKRVKADGGEECLPGLRIGEDSHQRQPPTYPCAKRARWISAICIMVRLYELLKNWLIAAARGCRLPCLQMRGIAWSLEPTNGER